MFRVFVLVSIAIVHIGEASPGAVLMYCLKSDAELVSVFTAASSENQTIMKEHWKAISTAETKEELLALSSKIEDLSDGFTVALKEKLIKIMAALETVKTEGTKKVMQLVLNKVREVVADIVKDAQNADHELDVEGALGCIELVKAYEALAEEEQSDILMHFHS